MLAQIKLAQIDLYIQRTY